MRRMFTLAVLALVLVVGVACGGKTTPTATPTPRPTTRPTVPPTTAPTSTPAPTTKPTPVPSTPTPVPTPTQAPQEQGLQLPPGDPARGEALFKKTTIGHAPGCITCHSLEPGKRLVGPSMAGIATVAEKAVQEGKANSVDEYLYEAIVDPDKVVTEGYPKGVMYPNYGKDLTPQQIADLIAFMKTLK